MPPAPSRSTISYLLSTTSPGLCGMGRVYLLNDFSVRLDLVADHGRVADHDDGQPGRIDVRLGHPLDVSGLERIDPLHVRPQVIVGPSVQVDRCELAGDAAARRVAQDERAGQVVLNAGQFG